MGIRKGALITITNKLEYFFGKKGELEEDLRSIGISRNRVLLYTGGR